MKTHLIWFCVSIAMLIVGMQFGKKEVQIIEHPAEIVKPKEAFVERPIERIKEVAKESAPVAEPKTATPLINKRHSAAEKAKLHQRYDPFLTQFGLTPAQMDRFVDLKLAIYEAQDDLQAAVAENSVPGGAAGVQAMRNQLTKPMWDEIRQLLGSDGYKAYGDYEQMSGFRPTVSSVFESAEIPISDQQLDQVTRLVIKNTGSYRSKPTDISSHFQTDWNAVARDAESILAPAQLAIIREEAARKPLR
jgi:hypothetical protein